MSEGPVLIVFEDSDPDITLLKLSLDAHFESFSIIRADDGERAMAIVLQCASGERALPDLFLIDINLPKRSGLEILAEIRSVPHLQSVPVVVLSSSESPRERQQIDALGVAAFLSKPMSLDEFMQIGGELKKVMRCSNSAAAS